MIALAACALLSAMARNLSLSGIDGVGGGGGGGGGNVGNG
jgi:hypothetical protein